MDSSCWQVLGIEPSMDTAAIRHAYQARLAHTNSAADYQGFKHLLSAYEEALRYARRGVSVGAALPVTEASQAKDPEVLLSVPPAPEMARIKEAVHYDLAPSAACLTVEEEHELAVESFPERVKPPEKDQKGVAVSVSHFLQNIVTLALPTEASVLTEREMAGLTGKPDTHEVTASLCTKANAYTEKEVPSLTDEELSQMPWQMLAELAERGQQQAQTHLLSWCTQQHPERLPLMLSVLHFQPLNEERAIHEQAPFYRAVRRMGLSDQVIPQLQAISQKQQLEALPQQYLRWLLTDDEAPLMAALLGIKGDEPLHRLYRYAWTVGGGGEVLLEEMLSVSLPEEALDSWLLTCLQVQARQALSWCREWQGAESLWQVANGQPVTCEVAQMEFNAWEGFYISQAEDWYSRVRYYTSEQMRNLTRLFDAENDSRFAAYDSLYELYSQSDFPWPEEVFSWDHYRIWLFLLQAVDITEGTEVVVKWCELVKANSIQPEIWSFGKSAYFSLCRAFVEAEGCSITLKKKLRTIEHQWPQYLVDIIEINEVRPETFLRPFYSAQEVYALLQNKLDLFAEHDHYWLLLCGMLLHSSELSEDERGQVRSWIEEAISTVVPFEDRALLGNEMLEGKTDFLRTLMRLQAKSLSDQLLLHKLRPLWDNIKGPSSQTIDTSDLVKLRKEMDNELNPISLRFAISIKLHHYQTLVNVYQNTESVPGWKIWKPDYRVGRFTTLVFMFVFAVFSYGLSLKLPSHLYWPSMIIPALLGVSMCMRRLRDANLGWRTLLVFLIAAIWFPWVMFGILLFKPDPLPTMYGPSRRFSTGQLDDLADCLRQLSGINTEPRK
ncbi:hypothetical protein C4K68_03855 [Pokkaliibacter plantistimulans]|uniref:J domain-containing protein n=1 Tax=Proteobacteria bacterium 228 TaxID=2083153 RepID=A0A2S5KVH8_9PROT|nr:DUF805 domain-containing protein [Pokkaliibacter plantistimulans]PPC78652.1 hypothetical protein C4K68_03855 [Pokkaliibacter plantistimulans]